MRLSEEIRLGSLLVAEPQAGNLQACAIGMANLSAGFVAAEPKDERAYDVLSVRHPWLQEAEVQCPICSFTYILHNEQILWHLFDAHVMRKSFNERYEYVPDPEMTIDQLADFIRSIEPEPEKVIEPAEVLAEVDEAVRPGMDIFERWERSKPEVRG